ncbi:Aldo/keto reductase [Coprinopsis marcescibilis]|uniref:Aldo/keto reductase n=1 Tax=Coprinopsis marcescibilis TaxID=230819 RepID=A0A5C3KPE0_COPMA|nr:Aldo/keto reductase [Coprinopsis marcescibilis]
MPNMPTRKIGNDQVPEIGLGAMGLSSFYGSVGTDEERLKLLDAAYEMGCTFWDTADIYGDSEELIGKWFKRSGKRDEIFLASKFGFDRKTLNSANGNPKYAEESLERSLSRLGVDHIDLYYLHRADAKVPIETTVGAMSKMVKEGKVRYIGLSEISGSTLKRAHAVHPISAVQVEYSPFALDIEDEKIALLKTCRELGVPVVAYSPLGRGLLTGRYRSLDDFEPEDFRRQIPMRNFDKIMTLVENIKGIADKHNATPAQVSLAWLLAQGNDIFVIPGTKKVQYLKENVGAAKVHISKEEESEIRAYAKKALDVSHGPRYPKAMMDLLFVETPPLKT